VERKGLLELTNVRFHDDGHLLRIIDKIVSQVGRRVDESNPMVDARLVDGSRVNAIIPPLAVDGAVLSIRRFSTDKLMPDDLVAKGALTRGMMRLLEAGVKAKLNIVVSGGTGAGKTTLLNALSWFISPKDRILTIEDAAELQLKQPHVVRLETRPENLEGRGAVRQRQLLINSLRMRPDRIILGEVRGEEALDMLQAMNTGHDGSLTTVHANTPRDAISRLEVMVTLANGNLHLGAIRQQVASAVNILVQCTRLSDGTRRVTSLTEVTGMEGEIVTLQDIFVFEKLGLTPDGRVRGRFCATGILPKFNEKLLAAGLRLPRRSSMKCSMSEASDAFPFCCGSRHRGIDIFLLYRHLERRDTAQAVRRLATRAAEKEKTGRRRPRLIEAAGDVRGLLTGRLLDGLRLRESVTRMLETAALKWKPARLLQCCIALFLGGFLVVTLITDNRLPLMAIAAGAVLAVVPLWYVRRKSRRRVSGFEEQFPDFLEFVSRSMRAGHAFSVAIEMSHREFSDPLAGEMRRAFDEQNLGQPLEIVLRRLCERIPSMDVQFFVSAVLLQKRTGGNLAELLDKLAQLIRDRFKLRARIRSASAQGIMSGRILSAIPACVACIMSVVNPQYSRFFIDDP
jgi:pilus assembly protein CpaF